PVYMLPELCHRNMAFTLFHAEQMPKVSIQEIKQEKIEPGIYKIYVTIANDGSIPSLSALDVKNHISRPDLLTVSGRNIKVIYAAKVLDKWLNRVEIIKNRPERIVIDNGIDGKSSKTFMWIVKGSGKIKISFDAVKGGKVNKIIALK
ncbi:peptidase M14, partial [candidate division KSB1 bacterium]